ncbi:hypothetical protein CF326_g1632 [Tilletia indica]|nr:hypothetical protein CF326_g1632 [Tilletia indica]
MSTSQPSFLVRAPPAKASAAASSSKPIIQRAAAFALDSDEDDDDDDKNAHGAATELLLSADDLARKALLDDIGSGSASGGAAADPFRNLVIPMTEVDAPGKDLGIRPDAPDAAAYQAIPVEAFGAAMLRGMGWKEGMGAGRRRNGPQQAPEVQKRSALLGLGAKERPDAETDASGSSSKLIGGLVKQKPKTARPDMRLPAGPARLLITAAITSEIGTVETETESGLRGQGIEVDMKEVRGITTSGIVTGNDHIGTHDVATTIENETGVPGEQEIETDRREIPGIVTTGIAIENDQIGTTGGAMTTASSRVVGAEDIEPSSLHTPSDEST